MSSKLKSETARTNGAKSHGPVTPEGRTKSSANSRKHGLAAKSVLLPGESHEQFDLLTRDYIDQFQPQTGVEMDLVELMAVARWRLRRFLAMETNLFTIEIVRREKQIDAKFNDMDENARLAWVFQHMADNGASIAMLIRYEGAINRSYEKALKQLLLLQSRRPTPPPSEPWVRSVVSHSPVPDNDPRPDDVGPAPMPASRVSGRLDFDARPSARALDPRPDDVGPAPMPASRLSGRLDFDARPSGSALGILVAELPTPDLRPLPLVTAR